MVRICRIWTQISQIEAIIGNNDEVRGPSQMLACFQARTLERLPGALRPLRWSDAERLGLHYHAERGPTPERGNEEVS